MMMITWNEHKQPQNEQTASRHFFLSRFIYKKKDFFLNNDNKEEQIKKCVYIEF